MKKLNHDLDFFGPKVADEKLLNVFTVQTTKFTFRQNDFSGYYGVGPVVKFDTATQNTTIAI